MKHECLFRIHDYQKSQTYDLIKHFKYQFEIFDFIINTESKGNIIEIIYIS